MGKKIRTGASLLLSVALVISCFAAAGAKSNKSKGDNLKVKISAEIADFPLPYLAVKVSAKQQKAPRGWFEYRAALGWESLLSFYKSNMPGHGWKLVSVRGAYQTWRHGNRYIQIRHVRMMLILCLIQVRVLRG